LIVNLSILVQNKRFVETNFLLVTHNTYLLTNNWQLLKKDRFDLCAKIYNSGLLSNTADPLLSIKEAQDPQSVPTVQNRNEFAGASALLDLAEGSNNNITSHCEQAPTCMRTQTINVNTTSSNPGYIASGTSAFGALASTIPTFAADQTRQGSLRPALLNSCSNISSSLLVRPSLSTTRVLGDPPVLSAVVQMQYQRMSDIELLILYESLIRRQEDVSRSLERELQQVQGRHAQSNSVGAIIPDMYSYNRYH